MDILKKAIDNEENTSLLHLNFNIIHKQKEQILKQLYLSTKTYSSILKKLKHYIFVDEVPDMKYGSFIRFINISNPESIKLSNGGIVCEIKVIDSGIVVVCKNVMNSFFQLNMSETIIFRKLREQELILLSAIDYIK
jgi:hypothetical protein